MNETQPKTRKKNPVYGGRSTAAGVCFTGDRGAAFAELCADGTVRVTAGDAKTVNAAVSQADKRFAGSLFPLLFAVLFLVLAVLSLVFAVKSGCTGRQVAGTAVFWLIGWWPLACLFSAATALYQSPQDQMRFRRLHGAEHKVFNAYMKNGELPDAEQAAPFSRLSPVCGCCHFGAILFYAAFAGAVIAFLPRPGVWKMLLILLAAAVCLFWLLSGKFRHPFMLLELPATAEPGREELETARAALAAVQGLNEAAEPRQAPPASEAPADGANEPK